MDQHKKPRKHGDFKHLAEEAERKKALSLSKDSGLGGNGQVPHDLWRRIIPIAREYGKSNVDIMLLYTYLVANVNGEKENDRYMAAFPSVEKIAQDTGLSRNRLPKLSKILVASGLLKTVYDYTGFKRQKLYYPQYYTDYSDEQIRRNLNGIFPEKAIT